VLQVFLWKACHDILPSRVNLHCRKLIEDPLCPLCLQEEETTGHILWSCPSAQDVWMECYRKLQKFPSVANDFSNIFASILDKVEEEVQLCAVIARLLWLRRNTVIHGGEMEHPKMLVLHARDQVINFEAAMAAKLK
jgi:hypothetical protein